TGSWPTPRSKRPTSEADVTEGDPRLRALPAVDVLADAVTRDPGAHSLPRVLVLEACRETLEEERAALRAEPGRPPAAPELRLRTAVERVRELSRAGLERVVNATGVVLHTNLGRAP